MISPYCHTPECDRPREGNTDYCASCNSAKRKESRLMSKEPKKVKKPRKTKEQEAIEVRLRAAYFHMDKFRKEIWLWGKCDAYPDEEPDMGIIDHDHTISQKRCKELGKVELIWDFDNIVYSSRKAHMEWESYKSGLFMNHVNFKERMEFLKEHDPEGYQKRKQVVDSFSRLETQNE